LNFSIHKFIFKSLKTNFFFKDLKIQKICALFCKKKKCVCKLTKNVEKTKNFWYFI
jgi:hypothetical protein